jgi:hypothetical protein
MGIDAGWWHDFDGVSFLNPFTGVKIGFMMYLYGNEVKVVACINANPPGLLVLNLLNHIGYGDPTANCNFTFPVLPSFMKQVSDDVYVVNSFGSIFSIIATTSDVDINTNDTSTPIHNQIYGPNTRARAR